MYSLDVNFLHDRPDILGKTKTSGNVKPTKAIVPLLAGLGIGLIPLAAVGALYFIAGQQNAELETQINEVNGQIAKVDAKLTESRRITEETNRITGETQALAGVFNQMKPWSAMLQDLRDRIPPGVQVGTIIQTEVAPTAAKPAAPPPANKANPNAPTPSAPLPTAKVEISGVARSYNDVNDFLLTLQRSSFLKKDQTQLVSAKLIDNPTQLELPKAKSNKPNAPQVTYELPKVVEYRIQTSLSDLQASELLRELERKGAVGLVTRIRSLQETGVNPQ